MAFVDWKDSYSVGLPEIDQQHKRLLGIINCLHDAMKAGTSRAQVVNVVNELVAYTREHFSYEERMMAAARYADVAAHIQLHRRMTEQVAAFGDQVRDCKASTPLKLMEFLKSWLTDHILHTDMHYSRVVQQAGVR